MENTEAAKQREEARRLQFYATLEKAQALLDYLPEWLVSDSPREVNRLLVRLCREILVTPDRSFTITFRG